MHDEEYNLFIRVMMWACRGNVEVNLISNFKFEISDLKFQVLSDAITLQ